MLSELFKGLIVLWAKCLVLGSRIVGFRYLITIFSSESILLDLITTASAIYGTGYTVFCIFKGSSLLFENWCVVLGGVLMQFREFLSFY